MTTENQVAKPKPKPKSNNQVNLNVNADPSKFIEAFITGLGTISGETRACTIEIWNYLENYNLELWDHYIDSGEAINVHEDGKVIEGHLESMGPTTLELGAVFSETSKGTSGVFIFNLTELDGTMTPIYIVGYYNVSKWVKNRIDTRILYAPNYEGTQGGMSKEVAKKLFKEMDQGDTTNQNLVACGLNFNATIARDSKESKEYIASFKISKDPDNKPTYGIISTANDYALSLMDDPLPVNNTQLYITESNGDNGDASVPFFKEEVGTHDHVQFRVAGIPSELYLNIVNIGKRVKLYDEPLQWHINPVQQAETLYQYQSDEYMRFNDKNGHAIADYSKKKIKKEDYKNALWEVRNINLD